LVAEVDDTPVGYVIVASKYPGVPASEHVQQLKGLAVSPQLQGQGAGRRLVMEAAATARRRGARRLTLNVLGTNAIARELYERCGFVVEGVHPEEFHLGGQYVDDIVLALSLRTTPNDNIGNAI